MTRKKKVRLRKLNNKFKRHIRFLWNKPFRKTTVNDDLKSMSATTIQFDSEKLRSEMYKYYKLYLNETKT